MKMAWHKSGIGVVIAALWLVGCPDPPVKPLTPCTINGVSINVEQAPITKVDVLFMIDNSVSMTAEQQELGSKISRMIDVLVSGDLDGDKQTDFPAVEDLHVGVVTSDLGVGSEQDPGYFEPPKSCEEDPLDGDNGILQRGEDNNCGDDTSPLFLNYDPEDPSQFNSNFTCYASVGANGCGLEQQLEATLKALTPSDSAIKFVTGTGHGDQENDGFLRQDSVLALILATDEGDCSAEDPNFYHSPGSTGVKCYQNNGRCYQDTTAGLRCSETLGFGDTDKYPNGMFPISRYIDGFLALRAADPEKLVFAAITGVPEDEGSYLNEDDDGVLAVNYQALLDHDLMKETEVDICTDRGNGLVQLTPQLKPVCGDWPDSCDGLDVDAVSAFEYAFPARRIVKVAQGLQKAGASTIVQSICKDQFDDALTAIGKLIGRIVSKFCLPRDLERDGDGKVDCDVVEVLPAEGEFTTCADAASLGREPFDPPRSENGRAVCKVVQQGVSNSQVPSEKGWYYDDFTPGERAEACGEEGQRIAFVEGAEPPNGAETRLECVGNVQSSNAGDEAALGARCSNDEPCPNDPVNGELFCEPSSGRCQYACTNNSDCPNSSLTCDEDNGFCVNPTCN